MEHAPIQSPANQQAHDKIRGYGYQCWLTVEAWLQLGPEDTLFAECAEDFATFAETGDTHVGQAKATEAKLTLRSDDVVEAINHFWHLRKQLKIGELRYSFLSTSGITLEQNNPFSGVQGLALWQEVATSSNLIKAEHLRNYLATDEKLTGKLDPEVLAFLKQATAADALTQLFKPMVWDMEHPDSAGIRASVENQLASLVERYFATTPTHRHNLADSLFTKVNVVAASKDKLALTRDGLMAAIESHLIPAGHAAAAARMQEILGGLVVGSSKLDASWTFTEAVPPIELAEDYSRRAPALAALQATAGTARLMLIEGSSGMGKSTLAQIYAAAFGGKWLHFHAYEEEPVRTLRGIQLCTAIVAHEAAPFGLIIDDLPWAKLNGTSLNVIRGLVRAARNRSACLIFTNQRAPSPATLGSAGLADVVLFTAPTMDQTEVIEIAERLGCTDLAKAELWAPLVVAQTSGHPRLVHAHLRGLKARAWPDLTAAEFQATNSDVQATRSEAQLLLTDRRTEELELLTRLSAFMGTFRRDQALAIAERLERITGAAIAFENLLGPWIEPRSRGRYQLSPLLGKTLLAGLTKSREREVHRAAIIAVVTSKPIEAGDATGALLNAVLGGVVDHASELLMKFLMAPREHSAALHSHLSWTTIYATEGQVVFAEFPAVDFMFRLLQFEVAASFAPERAEHFLQLCDQMIAGADTVTGPCYRAMLAFSLIKTNQAPVAFDRLFWAIPIFHQAMAEAMKDGTLTSGKLLPPELNPDADADESETFIAIEIWTRAGTLDGLRRLFATLSDASEEDRIKRLVSLGRCKPSAILAFDQVWLAEDKKAVRQWQPILELFYQVLAAAEKWGDGLFAACAARGISIIHDEYQDQSEAAEQALVRVKTDDPTIQAIVTERRAKSALLAKRYDDAQKLFEETLLHSPWVGFTAAGTVALYQNAGTAAGQAGSWKAAAQHFLDGSKLAEKDGDLTTVFALLADAAYATWQTGDRGLAVTRLGTALAMTPKLPDPGSHLRSRRTLRFFGHLLTHLAWAGTARSEQSAASLVTPGMCSEARDDAKLAKVAPPDIALFEVIYLGLVFQELPGSQLLQTRLPTLFASQHPLVRYFALELHARQLIRERDFAKLLPCAVEIASALLVCNQLEVAEPGVLKPTDSHGPTSSISFNQPFPIAMLLLSAVTVAQIKGDNLPNLFKAWRELAKGTSLATEFASFLDDIEAIVLGDDKTAATSAATEGDPFLRWAYALRLLQHAKPNPNDLLIASTAFTFIQWNVARFIWLVDAVQFLDRAIASRWREACEQRFAFRSPTLFIPDIKALAIAPDGSVAHIAKLVLASQPALSVQIDKDLVQSIQAIASGHGHSRS